MQDRGHDDRRTTRETERRDDRGRGDRSGGGLQYRQTGRRSEQGSWTEERSDTQRSGDTYGDDRRANEERRANENTGRTDDDMSNRRHVHERDPVGDRDKDREDLRSE